MPTPLGHALAGAAAGWLLVPGAGGRPRERGWRSRSVWTEGVVFALLGMLPDIDLLWTGIHRGPTHSLAAALIVGLAALAVTRQHRLALASTAAYASHALLDWLGTDTSPPVGITALWPMTREYYQSSVHLFDAVSRRYWLPGSWTHNLRAVGWEVLILLPLTFIALKVRSLERQPPTKI
jgi:hypothetical protein